MTTLTVTGKLTDGVRDQFLTMLLDDMPLQKAITLHGTWLVDPGKLYLIRPIRNGPFNAFMDRERTVLFVNKIEEERMQSMFIALGFDVKLNPRLKP